MTHARGTFDVTLAPLADDDGAGTGPFGRMSLDKRFHGDLTASSRGQMLGARTPIEGSAGYVAMELVDGTLNGRTGTFMLQHSGTMSRGDIPVAFVTVVPDLRHG